MNRSKKKIMGYNENKNYYINPTIENGIKYK